MKKFIIFCVLLIGCVSDLSIEPEELCESKQITNLCPQLPLIIDLNGSNIDIDLILEATEAWEFYTDLSPCYFTNLFEFGIGNLTINEVEANDSTWVGHATWYYSHNTIVKCDIKLKSGLWTNNVLIHELGHCLGLPHDNKELYPNSVMRQYTGDDIYILPHHINHLLWCYENSEHNVIEFDEINEDYIYFE